MFETCCTRPAPPQVGQVTGSVPGSAPLPLAGRAGDGDAERHVARDAARGLDELDLDLGGDVRAARGAAPAADAEEVVAEERGEEVAERPEVEARGREAAAAQAGVAEAVVELARARGSESTSYASTTSLKRSSASGASETSGCSSRASPRNAFLISASVAVRSTPSSS